MRILQVQLTNIKSYEDQSIRLEQGTNSICGQNGAGKTTIVEAVGWALFDYLPYNQKQFVRDGANWGQVTVTFQARDGREYQVVRRAGSGAHWYVFDIEIGSRLAEGSADVNDWLKRQLVAEDSVTPRVLFENAVGVQQGGLCAPFLQTPERRKQAFDPILRVHEYSQASDQLRETRSHVQKRVDEQQSLANRHGDQAAEIPALDEEICRIQGGLAAAQKKLEEVQKDRERQADRVAALESEEKRIAGLQGTVERLRQGLRSLEDSRRGAQARVDQAWKAHETVERTIKGHNLYLASERRLRELEPAYRKCLQLRSELDGAERNLQRTDAGLTATTQRISESEAAQRRLPELEATAEESAELGKTLHALEISAHRLPTLRARLKTLAEQTLGGEREIERINAEMTSIEKVRPEAELLRERREKHQQLAVEAQTAGQAGERLKNLSKKDVDLTARLKQYETRVQQLIEKSRVDPKTEQLIAALPGLQEQARLTDATIADLRVERARVATRREQRTVACPLEREDCLTIQRRAADPKHLDRELARIERTAALASEQLTQHQAAITEAQLAEQVVQEARVSQARVEPGQSATAEVRTQIDDLRKEAAGTRDQADALPRLQSELHALSERLSSSEKAGADVQRLPDLARARQSQEGRITEWTQSRSELQSEIDLVDRETRGLAGLKARQEELRDATDERAQARVLAGALTGLRAEHESLAAERRSQEERIETLSGEVSAFGDIERQRQEAEQILTDHRPAYQEYLGNVTIAEELSARQIELKRLETEVLTQSQNLGEQEAALQRGLQKWSPDELAGARARREELTNEAGEISATVRSDRTRLAERQERRQLCEEHARKRDEALREAQRLQDMYALLEFARRSIKDAQAPITEALLYRVSQEARSIFADVIDDHSVRLTWTPEYEVQLERGADRLTFNQLSGGEQMSAALAVRLALLKKLSDVDVAFLDEPTQNMDEARRTNLAAQVSTLKGFEQLFVISHDDTFEQQLNHAVVVRKQQGDSVVSYGHEEQTR